MERQISSSIAFLDKSNLDRVDPRAASLFEKYNFTFIACWDTNKLPIQRCSDDTYIPDKHVVDYYRNLDYRMIEHIDYPNRVIEGMTKFSCWLITSICETGMQSPLNMYLEGDYSNIHPGKKRYIAANYVGLASVPVVVQQLKTEERVAGLHIANLEELSDIYGNNVSIKVAQNYNQDVIECSWHGETNSRDPNGYDDWWSVAGKSINHENVILDNILYRGLAVRTPNENATASGIFKTVMHPDIGGDFYIESERNDFDFWQLYFHFDPRVGKKVDKKLGISIINHYGDPDWVIEVDFSKTLNRPWITYSEKT